LKRYPDPSDLLPISLALLTHAQSQRLCWVEESEAGIMKHPSAKASPSQGPAQELRKELARKIALFIGSAENRATEIPGLTLHRRTAPTAPCSMTYEPSLTVLAQGRKRVELGRKVFLYDPSRFLLTSLDLPVVSRVIEASEEAPCLALSLKLEMAAVRELLSREEIQVADAPSDSPGMATGETTVEFLSACCRLVDLLQTPQDIPFLSGMIQREIIYRILRSAEGARLRAIATLGEQSQRTAKSNCLDQGKLCQAGTGGRSGRTRGHGCIDAAPSFPRAHRHESAAISETASAAGSAGPHAPGWPGRRQRSLRSGIRKRQPVQPGIQPFLRPTAHAGCQGAALAERSADGVGGQSVKGCQEWRKES
jgi:hypothetical protein